MLKESVTIKMGLNDKVKKDMFEAMKNKDTLKKGVLQLLKARFDKIVKEATYYGEEDFVMALQTEIKQTRASLSEALKFERKDIADMELKKIKILEEYLPEMLTKDEIVDMLNKGGFNKDEITGRLIGLVMKDHRGRAEITTVLEAIEEFKNEK